MKAPFVIGRLLFGGFFLYNGLHNLRNRRQIAPYVESKAVPNPELAVALSGVPPIIGGASLLLGGETQVGAAVILGFLAGVFPIMHDFWRNEVPNERQRNVIDFMKNAALAGGALALMGIEEPWEASVPVGRPGLGKKLRKVAPDRSVRIAKRKTARRRPV